MTRANSIKALWPLLLPVLLLLPGISGFPYPSADAQYSDISVTHYPNAIFLRRSLLENGQIPLWTPTILSGYPFAANPLSGLWYPPGWLALLMPLPLGFNAAVIIHLLLGGIGMYLLVLALGKSHPPALFAALALEAMPKVFAHYGAGHLTMINAIMLTPWLLLAEVRSWQPSGSFCLRQPGIILALIVLADPRWAVYSGLLWVTFHLIGSPSVLGNKILGLMKQTLMALALAAPLLIPLVEYSRLSTRSNLASADLLAYSLPPAGLLGLLAPQFGGFHEWVIYIGGVVLLLALMAIVRTQKQKMDWLWISVVSAGLIFSLGEHVLGISLLARLPGLSLLRVPPRVVPVVGLAFICLAAGVLDGLLNGKLDAQTWRRARLGFVAIIGLQAGLAFVIWLVSKQIPVNYLWVMLISALFIFALYLFSTKRINTQMLWVSLMVLSLVDLGVMDESLFSSRDKNVVLAEGADAAAFLAQQPGQFRVYSPSYSIPQQTAAEHNLELADGVDPLQLQTYSDFMEKAIGVKNNGYSVTLPAFANDPAHDNQQAVPDIAKLALLNIGYVASEFEIDVNGLELLDRFGSTNVYKLIPTLPRAFMENDLDSVVTITQWTPNIIELTAEGPGRLVFSELMYPGWLATVDGQPTTIEPFSGILRSVMLTDGTHDVVFEFRPKSVYAGFAVFLITLVLIAFQSRKK